MQKLASGVKPPSPSESWPVSIKGEKGALEAETQEHKIISSAPSWNKSEMISCWQFAYIFLVIELLHNILWPTWLEDREGIFVYFVKTERNIFLPVLSSKKML